MSTHCSYCLIPISGDRIKRCGKCNRRAYCSRECQVNDWRSPTGNRTRQQSQGHKKWCQIPHGQEGLDWKIVPIEGKGLGVVAMREIPPMYRIMVDACQLSPTSHPMTMELYPKEGTLHDKWIKNVLSCDSSEDDVEEVLCLQLSRVNHACGANATHIYDNGMKVKILFAERNIAIGEEICIGYANFDQVYGGDQSNDVCPRDCICHSPTARKLVDKECELDSEFMMASRRNSPEDSLQAVDKMLEHQSSSGFSVLKKKRTFYDGIKIAVRKENTLPQARRYIGGLLELYSAWFHPESTSLKRIQELLSDLTKHRHYLIDD